MEDEDPFFPLFAKQDPSGFEYELPKKTMKNLVSPSNARNPSPSPPPPPPSSSVGSLPIPEPNRRRRLPSSGWLWKTRRPTGWSVSSTGPDTRGASGGFVLMVAWLGRLSLKVRCVVISITETDARQTMRGKESQLTSKVPRA